MSDIRRRVQPHLERWSPVLLTLLAVGLRLWGLGSESLWFDEGWSAVVARLDGPTLRNVLATQPFPLYYALLHLWAGLGDSEFSLRLLSALAGALTVPFLYALVRGFWGAPAARWAGLLLAISPLHIWYSQEARMYALATLWAAMASWALLQAARKPTLKWWGLYVVLSTLALYTFYYAALVLAAHGLYLLYLAWRSRTGGAALQGWLLALVALVLLFIPGLVVLFSQLEGGTWGWVAEKYGRPGLGELVDLALAFSVGNTWAGPGWLRWAALAAYGLAVLAGMSRLVVSREHLGWEMRLEAGVIFWGAYLVAPIGAILALSQFHPSFVVRYLVLFLPPWCALAGRGLASMARLRGWRWALAGLLLLASALSLRNLYQQPQKEDWRGVAQRITVQAQPGDAIALVDEDTSAVFGYYYQGPLPVVGVSGALEEGPALASVVERLIAGHQGVWVVTSHTTNDALWQHLALDDRLALSAQWEHLGIRLALFRRVK